MKKVAVDVVRHLTFRFSDCEGLTPYIVPFFQSIWKLIPLLPSSREFNKIVQSVINYVQDSLSMSQLRAEIESEMETLFRELILKHLSFTSEDLDEFDCDSDAFIKMDLEENDKETRRRACFNLIAKLQMVMPKEVGDIVNHF